MKKRILMTLVTLTLLSSMILCALLGVTKAEYFKMLSKKLDFEVMPDLPLEYYLYHAKVDDPKTTTNESLVYAPERGTYKDAENFIQWLRPGHLTSSEVVEKTNENGTGGTNVKSGKEMVYQIKVPVNETGYYTLDFLTYILFGNDKEGASYLSTDFYTISYRYCLGCEVLTQSDNIEFGTNTPLDMPNRVFADDSERKDRSEEKVLYSDSVISNNSAIPKDSVYQWKTLCPYRAENVSLTFKAEQSDVDKGYVIWAWDFTGLEAGLNYALYVEGLSVNKRMELDGTTKYRDSNTPYFMFPQTAYVNNIVDKNGNTDNDKLGAGRNRWSSGRGTYVTEATDNSLGMRAELLWGGANKQTDNPVSLYIPLKNVQRGATYKVTFDFSVARQGAKAPDSTKSNGVKQADINTATPSTSITDWHNYNGDFNNIFDNTWSNETGANNRIFQSYLISGDLSTVASLSRNGHRNSQDLITYNNKHYSSYNVTSGGNNYTYGYPLTKYDEVVKFNNNNFSTLSGKLNHTMSTNINDTYSVEPQNAESYDSTTMRNFFNAVKHTEYNGQYEINWVTFYNTTFSFNIASDADLDELYWVWAIDALRYTAFYNLRIENVRIERVVEFASELDNNGLMIGNNKIGISHMDYYGLGTSGVDDGPFHNYRGWNSTGQNYQARGHATTTYLPKGNIYAPIVDASRFTLTNDFTIKLDGKAVLKGGVDRYVYSIDGGRTWADMEFSGGKASADQLKAAEAGIDLSVKGQTPTDGGPDMIEFNSGDAYNASFDDFALSVDLVKYKHQANLNIIIAAVPNNHPDYRCEILRIVNFNQIKNYLSFPYDFVSDIKVTNKIYNTNGETSPLNAHRIKDDNQKTQGHYYYSLAKAEGTGFTQMKTVRLDTKVPTSTTCYSRTGSYSHAYEDVRAAWTGFAVKRTLGITGWAMAESGIQKYVWSADGGKTWFDCSGTPKERDLVNTDYENMFYDASSGYDENLKKGHCFRDSIDGEFDNDPNNANYDGKTGQMLTADLSGHVGEVVDVIFAAKPNNSEVYVPIGRVDNVAVYGDPTLDVGTAGRGMGTFCTHMNEVRIDDQTYQHGIRMSLRYDPNDLSNSFARMNWIASASLGIETATLNYLEPYHVNPVNARFFNETVQEVNSGGKIEIEGFTVVEGGVKRYKYSLDGGETWTILYTTQQGKYKDMKEGATDEYAFKTKALAAANACGISLEGDNGNNVSYTHEDEAWLVVNLPALPAGVEKNLLVVAESNIDNGEKNADGTSKGKGFIYPVLHMKIRIKNEGVGYFLNDANGAQAGRYSHGSFSQTFKAGNNATYKLTFPVSKEGVHTLTFNAALTGSGTITTSVLHEETEKGGERYFASKEAVKTKGGTVDKIAIKELTNASTAQDVDFYFNATADDVKRGYVVLDFDLSKLTANANYVLNIDNLMYSYGVKSTKRLVTDENGNASYTIRVPALEVGTHEFAFSSYASSYGSIIHNGLDQTVCKGYTKRAYGGNYLAAGAYMSVEKNVFMVGEPIHVSYKAAGAKTSPWIGVTKSVDGRDVVVGRVFLEKNAVGKVTFRSGMYGCVEVIDSLADLPAGDYKLYFRDNSANIYCDKSSGTLAKKGEYWPEMNITDPIAITIIDPNKSNEKPCKQTYSFDDVCYYWDDKTDDRYDSNNRVSGWVSIDKTVFRVGDDISFDCEKRDPVGNPAKDDSVYLGFLDPKYYNNSYLNDYYRGSFEEKIIDITKAPNYPDPGRYQLYCCDFGFATARKSGSVMGALDIVMLPQMDQPSTLTMSYDHLKKNDAEQRVPYNPISAYDYSRNSISIDITQADVDRGYVEFEYELTGLVKEEEVIYTTEMFYERFGYDPNFIYERQGDYLYFGLYPQTLKPENVNIFLKDGPNEQGYYKGSDGYLYAQVMADSSVSGYKFSNDSQILSGTTYYFRVEPLKWRIVGESDGDMTVICESIINAMEYGDSNNYEESAVRAWLANEFYNTAFNERQKALIKTVNVDNSAASTGYDTNSNACANTEDKIYLPSYSNVKNYSKAEVLSKTSTDFARVVGSYVDLLGKGNWMLRSPLDSSTLKVSGYDYSGRLYDTNVDDASNGVVPMLKLSYKFDDPNTQVGNEAYIVPPPGDEYGVTGGSYYGVSHENVLTSDFPITKGTSAVNAATYPGASISVDKVYYEYGEDIPIKYRTPNKTGNYRVYITMDEKGSADRYGTWVVKAHNVGVNAQGVVNLSNMSTELHSYVVPNDTQYWNTLPPGEYKIWLYDDRYSNHYGTAYNQYHANSAFITESLSIKILPPGEYNPDFSVTHYSDWEYFGTNYDDPERLNWTSLTLDKTVFKQGEKIRYYIDGSWEHKWVGVFSSDTYAMGCDKVENYPGKDKTLRYAQWGHKDYINAGSNYLETETLTPGQYKIVYVFGLTLESAWAHDIADYKDHAGNGTTKTKQRVMTVIDITILPKDCGEQNVTVNYTKADGTAGETVISRPIHFFTPISFDAVLDSVLPESSITFTTSTTGKYRTEKIIRTNVSAINYEDNSNAEVAVYDVNYSTSSNFTIEKPGFRYIATSGGTAQTKYDGSCLSLPGVYYEYGEPIMASYEIKSSETLSKPRIIITTEMLSEGSQSNAVISGKDLYVTIPIKYKDLTNSKGKIDVNDLINWSSLFMQGDTKAYEGALPVGVYKVWLVDDVGGKILGYTSNGKLIGGDFAENPFKAAASKMITEPITIKVIDPENPDFSIMSNVYAPNKGLNKDADVEFNHNTRIGIDKAIFTQGEKIRFHIQLDYSFRHVMITQGTVSNVSATNEPTEGYWCEANRGKTWQYAKFGVTDSGYDTLDTSNLEPGQYKIYYLMGETLQEAIRGDRFYHPEDPSFKNDTNATYSKLYTIIDIVILPKDASQTVTVTYTKYDGSTATITEQFPMMGTPVRTELHKGKELTRYHMGVNFTKIINDAMPGTNFEFSTTSNLAEVWGDGWDIWNDRTHVIDVLKQSAVRIN